MQSLNSTSLILSVFPCCFGVTLKVMLIASLYISSWKSGVVVFIGEASVLSSMMKDPASLPSGIYNIEYITYHKYLSKKLYNSSVQQNIANN